MRRRPIIAVFVFALAAWPAARAGVQAAAAAPDVDPDAIAALNKMGAYMRTLKASQVDCQSVRDDVLATGERITIRDVAGMTSASERGGLG